MVVETHAVDDGLLLGQAEQARLRIAVLRPGCNGADFDEAETECGQRIDVFAVFVQSGGQPYRIGQLQAHQFGGAAARRHGGGQSETGGQFQHGQSGVVGLFGFQAENQGSE